MKTTVKARARKINLREGSAHSAEEMVAVEARIRIIVNGKQVATLLSLPKQLKELGVGWLLSQAIVKSVDEIANIRVVKNDVMITCSSDVDHRLEMVRITEADHSLCGSTPEDFAFLTDQTRKPSASSNYSIKAEKLLEFTRVLNERAVLFRSTGGTHSAAIFHKGRLVGFAEDVGRHNAVDKVIGVVACRRVDFSSCVVASSGRQPADMVLKAARVGIPIIASIAGPISSGIDAAKKTGVTLVCFVRGGRMNVYSHPERIEVA